MHIDRKKKNRFINMGSWYILTNSFPVKFNPCARHQQGVRHARLAILVLALNITLILTFTNMIDEAKAFSIFILIFLITINLTNFWSAHWFFLFSSLWPLLILYGVTALFNFLWFIDNIKYWRYHTYYIQRNMFWRVTNFIYFILQIKYLNFYYIPTHL